MPKSRRGRLLHAGVRVLRIQHLGRSILMVSRGALEKGEGKYHGRRKVSAVSGDDGIMLSGLPRAVIEPTSVFDSQPMFYLKLQSAK